MKKKTKTPRNEENHVLKSMYNRKEEETILN